MTPLYYRDASLVLFGSVRLDNDTIARLVTDATEAASGKTLDPKVRIISHRPGVILLGVFRAALLGPQDSYIELTMTRGSDGRTEVNVAIFEHGPAPRSNLIPAGLRYRRGISVYVRFVSLLHQKLVQADPTADLAQRKLVTESGSHEPNQ